MLNRRPLTRPSNRNKDNHVALIVSARCYFCLFSGRKVPMAALLKIQMKSAKGLALLALGLSFGCASANASLLDGTRLDFGLTQPATQGQNLSERGLPGEFGGAVMVRDRGFVVANCNGCSGNTSPSSSAGTSVASTSSSGHSMGRCLSQDSNCSDSNSATASTSVKSKVKGQKKSSNWTIFSIFQ